MVSMSEEVSTDSISKNGSNHGEKRHAEIAVGIVSPITAKDHERNDDVFQNVVGEGGVDFRTVGWKRAAMIFVKSKDPT